MVQKGADTPEMPQQEIPVEQQRIMIIEKWKRRVGKVFNYGGIAGAVLYLLSWLQEVIFGTGSTGFLTFLGGAVFLAVVWLIAKVIALYAVMRVAGLFYTGKDIVKY